MTPKEYWEESPRLAEAYYKAYKMKEDNLNRQLWWQGLYIYDAVGVVHYNENKPKNKPAAKYPSEPYKIREDTKEEKIADKERAKQDVINQLNAMKSAWDMNNGK